jgi:hypothetical protein
VARRVPRVAEDEVLDGDQLQSAVGLRFVYEDRGAGEVGVGPGPIHAGLQPGDAQQARVEEVYAHGAVLGGVAHHLGGRAHVVLHVAFRQGHVHVPEAVDGAPQIIQGRLR